ncbi:polysaccharide pyruvyl transferase family protein [Flagellimonas sp. 2504JD1-5]
MRVFRSDILFSGYYGQNNTGDDSFVEVCSWASKKYFQTDNYRFLSTEKNLPNTLVPSRGFPFSFRKTYGMQMRVLLEKSKNIIFAGGSTFEKVGTSGIKNRITDLKTANRNLRIGAIGVSIGPFKSIKDEREVLNLINNMDFIATRDKNSFNYLNSSNVDIELIESFDLAALLPKVYNSDLKLQQPSSDKIIGVSICNYESYINGNIVKEKHRNKFMIELLSSLSKKSNFKIRFFIFNGNSQIGDKKITEEVIMKSQVTNYEIIPYNKETFSTWRLIKDCSVMISTRLHASIFACFANIPFFLVEYHRKCTDFLNDVGQSSNYRIGDGEVDPKDLADSIVEILNNDSFYIFPKNIVAVKNKSELNFTAVDINI